jgi:uncharacterized integral membrane protein
MPNGREITVSPKVIVGGLITAAAVWFILVNRARVAIYVWVPKVTAPLWLVLLVTFAAGMLAGYLLHRSKSGKSSKSGKMRSDQEADSARQG